uniref:Odorant binding protein n=1 Tax=Glyphodes pyloalis TaxID=1242752 RepID=A0A6M3GU99_GLYPY|nr:odorant binding protein [Glyphodes pyloalis]
MVYFVVKTLFVAVFLICVKADSEEDLKQVFVDVLVKCAEEFPPTASEIEMLKDKKLGESENVKCMFACTYKKTGMMNEKGELSMEGIADLGKKYYADDPEKTKQILKYAEACKSVNDQAVSDGEKGCERAALLFKCTIEKAAEVYNLFTTHT